jgi:hypothetical protein
MKKTKVLVGVLNWGLGHAARCIPVINAFQKCGCEVSIASDGVALNLLKKEFPHLNTFELPSYSISYPQRLRMSLGICFQMPKILNNIKKENNYLKKIQGSEHFDIIVSDCRFGCYTADTANIYITHQVLIRFPKILKVFEGTGAYLHGLVRKKFNILWIIDRNGPECLSGEMGQPRKNERFSYIGILSRFTSGKTAVGTIDACFLLSGPEPQRTIFEKIVLERKWPENKKYCLVRGLPDEHLILSMPKNWTVFNHLASGELQDILLSSKHIICRSGYSTIMDLVRLGLRATLIPTPGQPEQEYLAYYLSKKAGFSTVSQRKFLKNGIELNELGHCDCYNEKDDEKFLLSAVNDVLKNIKY